MKANENRIFKDVEFLTEINPPRSFQNVDSLEQVCKHLKLEFSKIGLTCDEQRWIVNGTEYKNIISSYNIEKNRRLIVGAHYDVDGDKPGADDNASSVAGLLEIARLVVENKPQLDYRIDFVSYCLEEAPFFRTDMMGSYIHAKSLFDKKEDIIGMIGMDMIGYFSDKPYSQKVTSSDVLTVLPSIGNFIYVISINHSDKFYKKIMRSMRKTSNIEIRGKCFDYNKEIEVRSYEEAKKNIVKRPYPILENYKRVIELPFSIDPVDKSDHRNYWKFGYNAVMIGDTGFLRNPNYHRITDTIDTLNFSKLAEVINCTYNAVINII